MEKCWNGSGYGFKTEVIQNRKEMVIVVQEWKGYHERRRGPDKWGKLLQIAPFIAWPIVFVILIFIHKAQPNAFTFFERILKLPIGRTYWDLHILKSAFYTSVILLLFSIILLIINSKRHRRKTDHYSYSLIASMIFSFIIIIFYLIKI